MPGVYAVKVKQKNSNKSLKAIANLGYRPTFNQKKILLEVHIFNFPFSKRDLIYVEEIIF